MRFSRNQILGTLAVLLLGYCVVKLVLGDGTITVDFKNAPLQKVISAIQWQGHVNIATNIDPTTPVTIKLDHAPLYDALDTLSVRVDGNLRLAYIGATDTAQIDAAVDAFRNSLTSNAWKVYGNSMGGGLVDGSGGFDPRTPKVTLTTDAGSSFQAALDQLSQKSGAMAAIPASWNPNLKKATLEGSVSRVFPKLAGMASGSVKEYFLIAGNPRHDNADTGWGGAPDIIGARTGQMNPDWMLERGEAVVAALPPDQRTDAQADLDFFKSLRKLSPAERRAKFDDPAFQDRMQKRLEARMDKMTPEQRSKRMQNYVSHKAQAQGNNGGAPHS